MMRNEQKILLGISILVGVICIELSMYVIPFIEEVTDSKETANFYLLNRATDEVTTVKADEKIHLQIRLIYWNQQR